MIELPLQSDWFYTTRYVLDGREFLFEFRYLERTGTYFLSIKTSEGDPIVSGLKCVVGSLLTMRISDQRLFSGNLIFGGAPPTPENIALGATILGYEPL